GSIVDRTPDQRLHGGDAAAAMHELHVKPMLLEVAGRARDFVRHPAQKLAAIGELDLFALRSRTSASRRRDDACDQRGSLEHRAPRYASIGEGGGVFIAAAHGSLQKLNLGADRAPSSLALTDINSVVELRGSRSLVRTRPATLVSPNARSA